MLSKLGPNHSSHDGRAEGEPRESSTSALTVFE
jgi:hypothetical protein